MKSLLFILLTNFSSFIACDFDSRQTVIRSSQGIPRAVYFPPLNWIIKLKQSLLDIFGRTNEKLVGRS